MQKEITDVFVRNRVSEITLQNDIAFRYINTKQNPADLPTRGISASELKTCKLWWNGPEWLLQKTSEWPQWNTEVIDLANEDENKDKEQIIYEMSSLQPEVSKEIISTPFGIDEMKYSSLLMK